VNSTPATSDTESHTGSWATAAEPLWSNQSEHLFVAALGRGDLPIEKFRFYVTQDYLFLGVLARVCAFAAGRCTDRDEARFFLDLAKSTLAGEAALHESYAGEFGIDPAEMEKAQMAPTNLAYCNFLLNIAHSGTATEIAVSILPCAWIYCDVGRQLLEKHSPGSDHPYAKWMTLYGSPEFLAVANWLRGFVDRNVDQMSEGERRRLEQLFLTAVRYEWLFWEMAWTRQGWPGED
jgi:thiaminase/transcriptional activator TenA